MSGLALDTPLGSVKRSALPAPGWVAALALAALAHAAAAAVYFSEPLGEEPPVTSAAPEEAITVMLAPPAPPAAEAAAPPPPPPPPDIELPDPPAEEPPVPAERADSAPPPTQITARRFADPEDEPVRRASAFSAGRDGPASGDARFTAEQYPIFQAYLREVRLTYVGELRYPGSAERQRLQGSGVLRVRVTRQGRVEDWVLHRPIGHAILDREVERAARRVRRLPPVPDALPYETLLIDVPVIYRIVTVD
ncbi:MAG: TonB family protein [Pseudomonadota bacterium]